MLQPRASISNYSNQIYKNCMRETLNKTQTKYDERRMRGRLSKFQPNIMNGACAAVCQNSNQIL
jgi:hypothetical protein